MQDSKKTHIPQVIALTSIALLAFAGNSVLCRLALGDGAIDPASFTVIRLFSGAITLLGLVLLQQRNRQNLPKQTSGLKKLISGSWFSSIMLALYATTFSFAYIDLSAGTGALILFASVQLTMIAVTILKGGRLSALEWGGLLLAFVGFVYLMLPYLQTPSAVSFGLMTVSGIAWGFYTLRGQLSSNPLEDSAGNFIKTLPLIVGLALAAIPMVHMVHISQIGALLAVLSGSLASGIGYAIWYKVLPSLSATQAATLQLLVPVIAAVGGVIWIGELISWRLIIAASFILGGILLVVLGRRKPD